MSAEQGAADDAGSGSRGSSSRSGTSVINARQQQLVVAEGEKGEVGSNSSARTNAAAAQLLAQPLQQEQEQRDSGAAGQSSPTTGAQLPAPQGGLVIQGLRGVGSALGGAWQSARGFVAAAPGASRTNSSSSSSAAVSPAGSASGSISDAGGTNGAAAATAGAGGSPVATEAAATPGTASSSPSPQPKPYRQVASVATQQLKAYPLWLRMHLFA